MSELQISQEKDINLNSEKEIEREEKELCCCSFFMQIKNFWHWFYSGRIRVSIDLFFLMWEKCTLWYNIGDLLAMIIGGAIKFLVSSAMHDIALQVAVPLMEIFLCLKFILPVLIALFYLAKFTRIVPDQQKVKKQIERDDKKYETGLKNIYQNGFWSSAGIKFVWQNFKGRLFDFIVTSMFLAFMNLSGIWFVLYCIFVIWGAIGIIKDIIIARYNYCCLRDKKLKSECNRYKKIFVEYAKYKRGRVYANEPQSETKNINKEGQERPVDPES